MLSKNLKVTRAFRDIIAGGTRALRRVTRKVENRATIPIKSTDHPTVIGGKVIANKSMAGIRKIVERSLVKPGDAIAGAADIASMPYGYYPIFKTWIAATRSPKYFKKVKKLHQDRELVPLIKRKARGYKDKAELAYRKNYIRAINASKKINELPLPR